MTSRPTEPKPGPPSFFNFRLCNSKQLNNMKAAPPLLRLLRKRNFETIINCLADPMISTDAWFKTNYSMVGESSLHVLLRHRPPAIVVQLMLKEYRAIAIGANEHPEHMVDLLGRTPLHIAVTYLCTPDVIEVLLSTESGRQVVKALDVQSRLPLHLAAISSHDDLVEFSRKRKKTAISSGNEMHEISRDTIELLLAEWPDGLLARDSLGMTPLQYATDAANDKNEGLILSMQSKLEDVQRELQNNDAIASINGRSWQSIDIPVGITLLEGDLYSVSTVSMSVALNERGGVTLTSLSSQ